MPKYSRKTEFFSLYATREETYFLRCHNTAKLSLGMFSDDKKEKKRNTE